MWINVLLKIHYFLLFLSKKKTKTITVPKKLKPYILIYRKNVTMYHS